MSGGCLRKGYQLPATVIAVVCTMLIVGATACAQRQHLYVGMHLDEALAGSQFSVLVRHAIVDDEEWWFTPEADDSYHYRIKLGFDTIAELALEEDEHFRSFWSTPEYLYAWKEKVSSPSNAGTKTASEIIRFNQAGQVETCADLSGLPIPTFDLLFDEIVAFDTFQFTGFEGVEQVHYRVTVQTCQPVGSEASQRPPDALIREVSVPSVEHDGLRCCRWVSPRSDEIAEHLLRIDTSATDLDVHRQWLANLRELETDRQLPRVLECLRCLAGDDADGRAGGARAHQSDPIRRNAAFALYLLDPSAVEREEMFEAATARCYDVEGCVQFEHQSDLDLMILAFRLTGQTAVLRQVLTTRHGESVYLPHGTSLALAFHERPLEVLEVLNLFSDDSQVAFLGALLLPGGQPQSVEDYASLSRALKAIEHDPTAQHRAGAQRALEIITIAEQSELPAVPLR